MPTKKKEYVKFGTTKIIIPKKMVEFDKQNKPHIYKTITSKKRLSYHNKKPALDITVNNNTKTKINRVPYTTKLIKAIEQKKKRKPRQPRQPRLPPAAGLAPPPQPPPFQPPPPPPPFQPPAPPQPRPPAPQLPRPENPPYQPPPRPPPPPSVEFERLLVRQQIQQDQQAQQALDKLLARQQKEQRIANLFGRVSTNFLEADRQNVKLDIAKGQAQQALDKLLARQQKEQRIANLFGRVSTNFLEADRQNVKLDIAKGQAQQALDKLLQQQQTIVSEKRSKLKKAIEKKAIRKMQIIKVKKEPIREVQVQSPEIKQAVIQMQQQMEALTQSQELAKISREGKKSLKKMTEEQKKQFKDLERQEKVLQKAIQKKIQETAKSTNAIISEVAVIQKTPPTIEQQQKSALLLQKVIRGHKGRLITSEEVSKIIANAAANRIKSFILRRRLFKIIYSLIPEDNYKQLFLEEEKKLRAAEKRKKALALLEVEQLKIMEQNKQEMEDIYRKIATFKKVKERKPKLINEDDPISVIVFEERIGDYSAKILQARLRTNKNLINMAIERYKQLEIQKEIENQLAIQSLNSLFNTIWIDPDAEVKPSDVKKIEEIKADGEEVKVEEVKTLKPKKKVMTMPKPID
jgi:hypothetical protein